MMKTSPFLALLVLLIFPFIAQSESWHDPVACTTAQDIYCGSLLNDETNYGYSNKLDNYSCSGYDVATGYNGPERIYRLDVYKTEYYQITIDDIKDEHVNFDVFLMSGSCEAGKCIASSTGARDNAELIYELLSPGVYYLIVDTWKDEIGTFDLSVTCTTPPPPPSCLDALWLKCDKRVTGNTKFSNNDYNAEDYTCYSGAYSYDGPDDIYVFEKNRPSDVIQLHLFTDNPDLNIILVNQCDKDGFRCVLTGEDFIDGTYIDEGIFGLPTGWYYVIVDGKNADDEGAYELVLTCGTMDVDIDPINCGAPMMGEDLGDGENNWAVYSCGRKNTRHNALIGPDRYYDFTIEETTDIKITVSNIENYGEVEVFLFQEGRLMPQCQTIGTKKNGIITIEEELVPGYYIIAIDGKRAGTFDITLSGCPCKADAILICDEAVTDTNKDAGNNISQISGGCAIRSINVGAQDRIYEFTAPETKTYSFLLYDIAKDLDLFILTDCSNAGDCLGNSRTSGNERVTIPLTEGQTYMP